MSKEVLKIYELLFSEFGDPVYVCDRAGVLLFANRAFEEMVGVDAAIYLGKPLTPLLDDASMERAMDAHKRVLGGETVKAELCFKGCDVVCEYQGVPYRGAGGSVVGVVSIARDITEKRRVEEALRKSEESLASAQKIAGIGNWDWHIVTNELWWSDEIYRMFGLEPQSFGATYEAFLATVHPDDRSFVNESVSNALYERKFYNIDHRIVIPGGIEKTVNERAEIFFDDEGSPVRMVGTVHDITERKKAETELRKLSMAIDNSTSVVFITDTEGTIEYVNPMFERLMGYTKEEAIGKNPSILSSGETTREQYEKLWETVKEGKTWRYVFKNLTKSGEFVWVNSIISPVRDDSGKITNFMAVQEDVTEKRNVEETMRHISSHDSLTGLLNRSTLIYLMDDWLSLEARGGGAPEAALVMLDIDQFKLINSTYGDAGGDEVLMGVAKCLSDTFATFDDDRGVDGENRSSVAYLTGDEYAVFVPLAGPKEALLIAEKVRRLVEELKFMGMPMRVTSSVGLVTCPDHGRATTDLLKRADVAILRSRERGGNRCHVFSAGDMDMEESHSRLEQKEMILAALDDGRFEPWFQPLLDLKDGTVHHYEALARLRDKDGRIRLPADFIASAERFGLVGRVDMAIIDKVVKLQATERASGRSVSFALNLSAKDLLDEEVLNFIRTRIKETGADPSRLIFEITETAALHNMGLAVKFIDELKDLGCRFALDDFGVGFTSYNYLKTMKVDFIKIDGSFIRKLGESVVDQAIVRSITDVARAIGIKTVAEFVETEEAVQMLMAMGVDYAQGYHVGMPAPELLVKDESARYG